MSDNFTNIVVVDFEYEIDDNLLPNVLCMVAYVLDEKLQHVRTIRMWRGEFGKTPPFDTGPDTLFVAYSAWAEMTCFMMLGWQFPVHIFDQHTAYLAATNILLPYNPDEKRTKERKRLSDACRRYDITGWERIDKEEIAKAIGERRWHGYGQEVVYDYCEEDVRRSVDLLRAQLRPHYNISGHPPLPAADVDRVLHWSNYSAKAVAQIQAHGIPVDLVTWNLVQENKKAVVTELLRRFDPSHGSDDPIYNADGEWSYSRFEQHLMRTGVTAWPRLESGALDLDSDTWRLMSHIPGIEGLHALRDSLRVIVGAKLPIGRDGRNRPSLFPFGTATGRNAHSKSLFNAHAGMRSFMVFPPDKIGVYMDWRTQEVGIAAALSGDPALKEAYESGDVYHALAVLCGQTNETDPVRWKREQRAMRNSMKPLQLGILYGMGVPSLAHGLQRHPVIASDFIERHKRRYPRFWSWREEQAQVAMLERRTESVFGWPLRISTSPNKRTLYNFPMQSGGAEMLRLATQRLCEAGMVPNMLIHDGVLLELDRVEQIEHAKEIMRQAGRDTCDGLEIGADEDQRLVGGARYQDKRNMAKIDVGHHHRRAAEHRGDTEEGRRMTRKLYSPSAGKWVEVESVEPASATTKQAKTTGPRFTMFPTVWRQQMRQVKASGTTYEVAMVILDKARFTKGWFTLPNAGLAQSGIDRRAKKNALRELEDTGLIMVERRGRRSPRIKALYTGQIHRPPLCDIKRHSPVTQNVTAL